jgi:hypothetical protein
MKNLFCFLPSSGQQTVLSFYVTIRLSTAHEITLGLVASWSLLMVISALRPPRGKDLGIRQRGIVGVAGALGLLSVLGRLYWYTYDLYSYSYWGIVRPSFVAYAFYIRNACFGRRDNRDVRFCHFSEGRQGCAGDLGNPPLCIRALFDQPQRILGISGFSHYIG